MVPEKQVTPSTKRAIDVLGFILLSSPIGLLLCRAAAWHARFSVNTVVSNDQILAKN